MASNKRVLCLLLALIVLMPAMMGFTLYQQIELEDILIKQGQNDDTVVLLQMRLRDLGYYQYKITGYFGSFTEDALKAFQEQNKLSADGVAGEKTLELLYSNDAKRKPVEARKVPVAPERASSVPKKGVLRDWFKYVNKAFPRGSTVKVMDVATGITFKMTRTGGYNHADSEPPTTSQCELLKKALGGSLGSWTRRPVLVRIGGEWVAASMHGAPHAFDRIGNNGMNGHVCIHFLNSRTHGTNSRDPDHQRCVLKAAGQ